MATMNGLELGLEIARQQVLGLGHPGYNVFVSANVKYGSTMNKHRNAGQGMSDNASRVQTHMRPLSPQWLTKCWTGATGAAYAV